MTNDVVESAAPPSHRPVLLHVAHSWGGGIERWVRDFASADSAAAWNLVLRSRSWRNEAGCALELVDPLADGEALLQWKLEPAIPTTDITHPQYRQILADLVASFGIDTVVVSSLIGHSLEALDTGLPTLVVLHDLYPFCPALFGYFGESCTECAEPRLGACLRGNPLNVFWHRDDVAGWMALRNAYDKSLRAPGVRIAAPSRSVTERYACLFPVLSEVPVACIPHGLGPMPLPSPADRAARSPGDRLRVLVPGRLVPHKGLHLFEEILPGLTAFADVSLLGCGDTGLRFEGCAGVTVVKDYDHADLGRHVGEFAPDVALLISVLPETFSYTLSEMWVLGVPVVATRSGAFAERIRDGENGFLVEPLPESVESMLRALATQPERLEQVAARLATSPVSSLSGMVEAYRALLPQTEKASGKVSLPGSILDALSRTARHHAQRERALRDAWLGNTELANAVEAHSRHIGFLEHELKLVQERTNLLEGRCAALGAERDALLGSTSWRVTAPLRAVSAAIAPRRGAPPSAEGSPSDEFVRQEFVEFAVRQPGGLWQARAEWAGAECETAQLANLRIDSGLPPRFALYGRRTDLLGRAHAFGYLQDRSPVQDPAEHDFVASLDRVLVPAAAYARSFREQYPDFAGEVLVCAPPLLTRAKPGAEVRAQLRDGLGLPDGVRIVVAMGDADDEAALTAFAAICRQVCARRNDLRFLWIGRNTTDLPASAEVRIAVALRELFVLPWMTQSPLIEGCDVWLGLQPSGRFESGAMEAARAGLSAAMLHPESLPEVLTSGPWREQVVGLHNPQSAVDWLCADDPVSGSPARPRCPPVPEGDVNDVFLDCCGIAVALR